MHENRRRDSYVLRRRPCGSEAAAKEPDRARLDGRILVHGRLGHGLQDLWECAAEVDSIERRM